MKKNIVWLLALLPALAFSQPTFIVKGKIIDAVSKQPLSAASVFAENTTLGTATDGDDDEGLLGFAIARVQGHDRDEEAGGAAWSWTAAELLLPVGAAARAYLERSDYRLYCEEAREGYRFAVDRSLLAQRQPLAAAQAQRLGLRVYQAAAAAQRGE